MVVKLFGNAGEISFQVVERESSRGDVRVRINARASAPQESACSMKDHHVWLDQADIRRFLADLAAFEQTHGSAARLQSMSPDAFAFTLLPVDRLGHCAAELSVKWQSYLEGGRRYDNSLKFAFDVFADNIGRFRKEIEMELVGA